MSDKNYKSGQFKPGASGNPNGRPKGSVNKKTERWKEFSEYMLDEGLEKFKENLGKLKPNQFCNIYVGFMEYFMPKLSRSEIGYDVEKPMINKVTFETIFTEHNKPKTEEGTFKVLEEANKDNSIEGLNLDFLEEGEDNGGTEVQDK